MNDVKPLRLQCVLIIVWARRSRIIDNNVSITAI